MKKRLIALLFLLFPFCLLAQEITTIKYFSDIDLKYESKEKKASFELVSTRRENDLTKQLFEISSGKSVWLKSYRNNKPYGTWYLLNAENSKTDSVVYGEFKPEGYYLYDLKNQKLLENVEGEFTAPKLIGVDENIYSIAKQHKSSDIAVWISLNVNYPVAAQIDGIQGDVQTQFTIDEEGEVGDVRIINGVNEILDIESYQLLNSLPKMQPAKLNGNPIRLYISSPVRFLLQ